MMDKSEHLGRWLLVQLLQKGSIKHLTIDKTTKLLIEKCRSKYSVYIILAITSKDRSWNLPDPTYLCLISNNTSKDLKFPFIYVILIILRFRKFLAEIIFHK